MEENSVVHMDTDVSSTTEDVVKVPVAEEHRKVETVIMVEEVKEEEMSLRKEKANDISLQSEEKLADSGSTIVLVNSPSKELPFKKITIKHYSREMPLQKTPQKSMKPEELQKSPSKDSPLREYPIKKIIMKSLSTDISQRKPIEKSPTKPDEIAKSSINESQLSEATQSSDVQQCDDEVDSSSKIDTQKSTEQDIEIGRQVTLDKETDEQKSVTKSPVSIVTMKDTSQSQESSTKDCELLDKAIPINENSAKTPVKESTAEKKLSLQDKSNVEDANNSKSEEIISRSDNVTTMDIDKEVSNDSQLETNSDSSEKEHNKSISRELKSLINSAKESKIINECTQLTSKTRKSRTPFDSSNSNLNASAEAEKILGVRRSSVNSQKSNCSEKSDKSTLKRSMRSQNPEFVSKVKQFLNSVTGKTHSGEGDVSDGELNNSKVKDNVTESPVFPSKKKRQNEEEEKNHSGKLRSDPYCWRCHWAVEATAHEKVHPPMHCTVCPRAFHYRCLTGSERSKINTVKNWVCPECLLVLHAESSETRSPAMKKISLGMLCDLLKFALERMMDLNGVEPFMNPVDRAVFPAYDKYVVHSMDLTLMKNHIADGLYGSTEAFLADAQWILHNSIIFNTLQSKLTAGARALVRSCRAEMGEIEACPECYAAAHGRRPTWFTDVCTTPHILLWAKLKGFPYWPAKGMSVNSAGLVDVRFFGAHDRAWVPAKDCFLYSEKDPNNFRTKRQDILDSMQEAENHIRNISRKYGKFVYPPFKTQFDASKMNEQLKMMIPSFEGEVRAPLKDKPGHTSPEMVKDKGSRSASKSSKSSAIDGDTSDGEDASTVRSRKMADGAVIAREEEDYTVEKEKDVTMLEIEVPQNKDSDAARKRRRSVLEEAVITIINSSSQEKRKRIESVDKPDESKTSDTKETSSKEVPAKPKEDEEKPKEKVVGTPPKTPSAVVSKPSSSTEKKNTRISSIKVISIANVLKSAKGAMPKLAVEEKANTEKPAQKQKTKLDRSLSNEKEKDKATPQEDKKAQKRRNSRSNKSLNISNATNKSLNSSNTTNKSVNSSNTTNKSVNSSNVTKGYEKKNKEITKDNETNKTTEMDKVDKPTSQKSTPNSSNVANPKSVKDRIQFDDDTSLAELARVSGKSTTTDITVFPTISNVQSLAPNAKNTESTNTKTVPKTVEITVEANSTSSIFTPTSTDNVRNMKDAVNKLQKLRSDTEPAAHERVGKVGVRAFARMTSPERESLPDNMQVEIKSEPIDLDDADRQIEKMDLMNAFQLRPVNPSSSVLRDVRINKVVVAPVSTRKETAKVPEVRPRAKKTFPQPKKPDDGRSELISKNSMVYIPIQPPMTQAPVRAQRPTTSNGPASTPPAPRFIAPPITSTANSAVNTVSSPLVPITMSTLSTSTATTASTPGGNNVLVPTVATVCPGPTIGQVPTNVHTVPLITSVNGQWTFSLQPVMSVGGVDGAPSPPIMNGLPEHTANSLVPLGGGLSPASAASVSTSPPSLTTITSSRTGIDNPPGELPRLHQRPSLMNPLDSNTPMGSVPPPSTAGPLTAKLNQNAVKMTDFFRTLLEDSLEKLDEPTTQLTTIKLQLEQIRWRHKQELEEVKHTHELTVAEMRSSFEKEKLRVVSETRRAAQVELEAAVKLAKSKQWCANCSQEAQFYCCWNTAYCDYPCQRAHWAQHYAVCTQQRAQNANSSSNDSNPNSSENRLQPPLDNLPKTTAAPNLTVGGKLAPSRVYTQESLTQKPSIIVSMVEDTSGNQTMKCVGTYKPPQQVSPLIINKQLMSTEEASKKVVTSGGYLIVGAANSIVSSPNSAPALAPPARRTHTIQYYT